MLIIIDGHRRHGVAQGRTQGGSMTVFFLDRFLHTLDAKLDQRLLWMLNLVHDVETLR